MALQSYESQMRVFPYNWGVLPTAQVGTPGSGTASLGTCGTPSQFGLGAVGHSWMTMILPQLEESTTYLEG